MLERLGARLERFELTPTIATAWVAMANVACVALRHRRPAAIFLAWVLGCAMPANATPLQYRLRGFQVGAHRGGFWSVVQSTSGDFAASLESGANVIEIDLRATKDGQVVVYHSDTLSKHTFCFGLIRDTTFVEIGRCGLLPTGTHIESFEDVLRWTGGKDVIVN